MAELFNVRCGKGRLIITETLIIVELLNFNPAPLHGHLLQQ